MSTTRLNKIRLYPIKSLDGVDVTEARVAPGGSLEGDREFAFFREDGRSVNGKKYPQLHRIRTHFRLQERLVSLEVEGKIVRFDLDHEHKALESWMGNFVGCRVFFRQNRETGFPDDLERSGPTVLSTQSLEAVMGWFDALQDLESVRRRFRANLELSASEPFWEDRLFGAPGAAKPFRIGEVTLLGIKPCARCPVPGRDPDTGIPLTGFQKLFSKKRATNLPGYTHQEQFPHYYFLSVNTRIEASQAGKVIRVGDLLSLSPDPRSADPG